MARKRVVIMGAAGRDFHNFNVVFRDDADVEVVAFTATQIPHIDRRRYPPELAGPLYPDGIPILPESNLDTLIKKQGAQEVIFAYSDVSHEFVMHQASRVLAAGADFSLLGPTARRSPARCRSSRSSPRARVPARARPRASWPVCSWPKGVQPAVIRHPMPYGDLVAQRVQRFAADVRSRQAQGHHRGARGLRAAHPARTGGLGGRRLRGHRRRSAEGSVGHHLGRGQQRLLVPEVRSRDRGGRPDEARARADVPPRRDEPSPGRHRGRQQGEHGLPARRRHRWSRTSARSTRGPSSSRPTP